MDVSCEETPVHDGNDGSCGFSEDDLLCVGAGTTSTRALDAFARRADPRYVDCYAGEVAMKERQESRAEQSRALAVPSSWR